MTGAAISCTNWPQIAAGGRSPEETRRCRRDATTWISRAELPLDQMERGQPQFITICIQMSYNSS